MKTTRTPRRRAEDGHALATVIVLGGVSLMVLAGTMQRTLNTARLNERSSQYYAALAAAEAATEQALAAASRDFQKEGPGVMHAKLPHYRAKVPRSVDHGFWGKYRFNNGRGQSDETYVEVLSPWAVSPLISQYEGLSGYAATYRVVSNARHLRSPYDVVGAVRQDVQIALIPLFQFAIFYNLDLEINPGPNMTVSGRVHSNRHLYAQPHATLLFRGDVTAAGDIIHDKKPGDPSDRPRGTIVYQADHDSGVNTLNLPLGTDNSPESVRQIVEIPPVNESPNSVLGKQRLYNQADLIILVYDDRIEARGGVANGNGPRLSSSTANGFVKTNASFFNKREGKTVRATDLDVGALVAWNSTPNPLKTALGHDVSSVYVADLRTQTTDTQPGIRVVNGQYLPPLGLTVATPQPLYVQGNYNAPPSALGSHNTAQTEPAAFLADAITVLSPNWSDAKSGRGLSERPAADTTVNAAFLAGIVPTTEGSYSGGVENFPRFLENWSGRKLTYNGSMIVMYPSQIANATWRGTGGTIGIYNPPVRDWAFDQAFTDPSRLPPATPAVRATIRGQWAVIPRDTIL